MCKGLFEADYKYKQNLKSSTYIRQVYFRFFFVARFKSPLSVVWSKVMFINLKFSKCDGIISNATCMASICLMVTSKSKTKHYQKNRKVVIAISLVDETVTLK